MCEMEEIDSMQHQQAAHDTLKRRPPHHNKYVYIYMHYVDVYK